MALVIPVGLLPHTAVLIHPADTVDGYDDTAKDYGASAEREEIAARITQTAARENNDNRAAEITDWKMVSNHLNIHGHDRLEWNDTTFEVVGPPALPADWSGRPHHTEVLLRVVTG